ncbi:MAG: hypothetical protein HWN65_11610 [Candidatus Helarchaeota archaeon]|nr:hypothetical protein [Candidatus Helarchaeota archaeon]
MSLIQRRARYVKSVGIAAILIGSMFLSVEIFFIYQFWIRPRAITSFFHFNIQYRAGRTDIGDNIIEEPYHKLLQMFDRHPTWNFSFELQAAMIERLMEKPEYEEILNLTRKLNHRGQLEIICGVYSSQLVHAYPQTAMEWEFKHTYKILEAANLTRSRVLLCQEGQLDLGFANILNSNWSTGIDTLLVSWQQIQMFSPPGHQYPDAPVYTSSDVVPGKQLKLLIYNYLPKVEAGYMHSNAYLGDAEIAVEQDDPAVEFDVDEDRLRAFEDQWSRLEREGCEFFTMEQWLGHCERVGAIESLDFYIPETHWGPADVNSSHKWMGNNDGTSDDGEMIANNRRGYFTVLATRTMYNYFRNDISLSNRTNIENLLEDAEKSVLLAMVTDTTGLTPRGYERRYGETNIYNAMTNCSDAVSIIISEIPGINPDSSFQVDLRAETVENITGNFVYPTYNGQLTRSDLPLSIEAYTWPNTSAYAPTISVANFSFEGFNYKSLEVIFPGTWDWASDLPDHLYLNLIVDASNIVYSPSLTDSLNVTVNMSRSDYCDKDPVHVFLPLGNGLIFIPESPSSSVGVAIINNCSSRHTTLLWEQDALKYWERSGIHLNASYHLLFLEDVQLSDAVSFAQRVNNQPLWGISDNITKMAGYYAYQLYALCANADI